MRKLAIAAVVAAAFGSSAFAADLPVKAPRSMMTQESAMSWTGFYVGANLGYGWASASIPGVGSNDLTGIVGGGQLGYNWQTGPLVFGVEGDFQGTGESRSDTALGVTVDQKLPWFATARGRLGYAWGPAMLYVTGGGAWVNYKIDATAGGLSASSNTTQFAWTVGGGVEWMFAPNWSTKLEYLYMDTGDTDVTLFGTTFTGRAKNNVVRVGVNYHF
jgi:outer membrane immunogenic protein